MYCNASNFFSYTTPSTLIDPLNYYFLCTYEDNRAGTLKELTANLQRKP